MPPEGLHYRQDGPREAPALVLGGSLGSGMATWDEMIPLLTRHYRVIRFDHWGHGTTPVPPSKSRLASPGIGAPVSGSSAISLSITSASFSGEMSPAAAI